MWSLFVVLVEATLGEPTSLRQVHELLDVEQFISQTTEERFGEAILPRAAWLDVQHLQANTLAMTPNGLCDELWAVVATNVLRYAARQKQIRQDVQHAI